MRSKESANDAIDSSGDRTKIDGHPLVAGMIVLLCLIPTSIYYGAFGRFGFDSTDIPLVISLSIQLVIPLVIVIHFFLNRSVCRMWLEGVSAMLIVIPVWMTMGSWPFFYFTFAPMPMWERVIGVMVYGGGTILWLICVWRDYAIQDKNLRLREILFVEEEYRFIYWGSKADAIVARLPQRNPFTQVNFWLASIFCPLFGGIFMIAMKLIPQSSGPHAMFLFLSFISFPLSQWILGYLGLRTVYFHIYLPLRIERETGKKSFSDRRRYL
ncbi:hypothetical protein ACU4GI_39815 [Cupriavidus basilensis]